MAVDLRDVARRSGVSVSTASRALRGSERVSAATQAKVRAAAEALGYRPNASARALRTARSEFIGLVVTNLVNTSFHTIAEVVQRELARHGYQLMLTVTAGDPAAELGGAADPGRAHRAAWQVDRRGFRRCGQRG